TALSHLELCRFRARSVGFVFQAFNLFPALTALENVEYTMIMRGDARGAARDAALEALKRVGMTEKKNSFPSELSGGQQQRVAIARALAGKPKLILADEPTASLDSKNALGLIDLFEELNKTLGTTFIFSTHDDRLISRMSRILTMRDGKLN